MNWNQRQRQRALEAIAEEEQRLREVQERIRHLEARQDMMRRAGVAQLVSNVRLEPRNDTARIRLEDLQHSMSSSPSRLDPCRIASVPSQRPLIDSISRPGRRNSFCLPRGSSIMNALPCNPYMTRLPDPSPMEQVPVQPLTAKRKRENVLDRISTFVPETTTRSNYQEIYMPAPKNPKALKGGGSFPLPPTREPKPLSISLKSYRKMWKTSKGEVFRTRLHRNQVTILNDSSITGQFSIKRRMR